MQLQQEEAEENVAIAMHCNLTAAPRRANIIVLALSTRLIKHQHIKFKHTV